MTRRILVSIVSEQTVPNILFIKDSDPADLYYFITTELMENKNVTKNILNSSGLDPDICKNVVVIEDSIMDIDQQLSKGIDIDDRDQIQVNITGGTKIMSLGVYNFFVRIDAVKIFYIPIGKNEIRQIFPLTENMSKILEFRIDLKSYLSAYGVEIMEKSFEYKNFLLKDPNVTNNLMEKFIGTESNYCFEGAEQIRKQHRGKEILKSKDEALFNIAMKFKECGIDFAEKDTISKKETKYLTGDWFEEYVYDKIKNILQLDDDQIGLGVQLVKNGSPNEYDVIFTMNNSLYVIECKTDVADHIEGKEDRLSYLYTNTLYKAATLKKEFGLWVNYYLFTLNDFSRLSDVQKKRAKQLDIKLVGLEVLNNSEKMKEYIGKM